MFKLLNKEDNQYEYLVYNLDTEYLNGIRRVLYSKLKSYCFDINSTVITKNNTNINNEIITHRLTLIPIDAKKKIHFKLHKKNDTNKIINVYSDDLITEEKECEVIKSILLHKLKPGEELELVTSTIESSGKEHTSFRSFSICHFKIMKFIYLKENVDISIVKNIVELYNLDLEKFPKEEGYKLVGYTNEIRDYNDPFKKILKAEDYKIKEVEYNGNYVYYFTVELYFEDDNVINKGIKLLQNDLNNFLNQEKEIIKKDKNLKLRIDKGKYHVLNIVTKYIRNKEIYSVYNKEHPLRDEILLEYRLNETNKNYEEYLKELISEINSNISKIIVS